MSEFQISVVRVGEVEKHPNADSLSITRVHGGYPCIIRTGSFNEGDLAVYVPVDSTLPDSDAFSFLRESERKRLRAKRLRGIFSMGLLVAAPPDTQEGDDVRELLGITKWEEPIDMQTGGEREPPPKGWQFMTYTDIEGLRRHLDILVPGEPVVMTEKLHGANARYVHDGERLWVGSRTQVKRESDDVLWWQVAHDLNLSERLASAPMKIFFGEVFGQVQDLKYGHGGKQGASFRAFDIFDVKEGRYMDHESARGLADRLDIQWVPYLYHGPWSPDSVEFAEGRSTIEGADNVREGFVVKPLKERFDDRIGRVILKMHGQGYLLRKQKKK